MKMVTTEKILQTMNSWQSGEVIAVRRKKCSGASSHPNSHHLKIEINSDMLQRDFISFQVWPSSNNAAFYKVQSFMYFWFLVLRKHECWTCVLFLPLSDQAPVSPCSSVSARVIDISGNMSSAVQPPADARQTAARRTDQIMPHISQNMNWSISRLLKLDLRSAKEITFLQNISTAVVIWLQ